MKVLQERHGVTNSAFASILILVLAALWVTTTVFSAEIENAESRTIKKSASNSVASAPVVTKSLTSCLAGC